MKISRALLCVPLAIALFAWSASAISAPGSYGGNVEYDGAGGNDGIGTVILCSVGLVLFWVAFYLISNQPADPSKSPTWWSRMDSTGKGVTMMVIIFLALMIGLLLS
jgi:hypothetical protein